ncbi:hypothetical protein OAA12_01790 [Akkermansiaceae bacterium]|jgi:hypothetical protein|nr:hypothetical protein [Akkermansiaceae bacterium]MDB4780715.1 hypothetical protein [bacterium]
MMNPKTRDEILLYWSGEADATQEAKMQVLLKSDPEVRVYFEELGVFDAFRGRLASLPAMTPSRSFAEGAVSEILAERSGWRGIGLWVSVAAVAIVILAVANMVWPSNEKRKKEVVREETQEKGVVLPEAMGMPRLSQRLFARERQTTRFPKILIAQERARKLRIRLEKFPQL